MRVKSVHHRHGAPGSIVVVEDIPRSVQPGDTLRCGEREWYIVNVEYGHGPPALILKGRPFPEEGDKLEWDPPDLLDRPLKALTVREAIEILAHESKERQELSKLLKAMQHALNVHEMAINTDNRMNTFKLLRETFNKIPPKWFHK